MLPGGLQSVGKSINTHPLLLAFIFGMIIMSGIATFFMNDRSTRSMFGSNSGFSEADVDADV